jgi:pSer/pThr/pTyr-binding forkhead associated (FHA) protein
MNVLFVVIAPKSKEGTFTVRLPVVVGRSEEAKFRIQQDRVSRKHCEFFATDGEVFIRDLGSTNGTFLEDEQVETSVKTPVASGAIVRVGSLTFRVEYAAAPGTQTAAVGRADRDESDVTVGMKQAADSEHLRVEHAVESVVDSDVPAQTLSNQVLPEDGFQPDTENAAEAEDAVAEESAAVDVPAANPEQKKDASTKKPAGTGFDFLAAEPVAEAEAEESPAWPGEAAAADDGPADDEELGDFFKGLK